MPAPTVLPGRAFQQVDLRSRLLFHWRASDQSLVTVGRLSTGVFTRASAGGEVPETNGRLVGPAPDGLERWEYVDTDADGERDASALRLEEARTNSVIQSENLSAGAGWTLTRLAADVNSTIVAAPDGRFTADLLTASTVNNTHFLERSSTTGALETNRALSLHARADGSDRVRVRMGNSTDAADFVSADFDLSSTSTGAYATSTGSGGTLARTFIQTLGSSWFRVGLAGNLGTTGAGAVLRRSDLLTSTGGASYAGTGESFHGWGMQIENGLFETSYIPTAAAFVTRAAETLYWPFLAKPQPLTMFVKFIERGTLLRSDLGRLLHIGSTNVIANARIQFHENGGRYEFRYSDGTNDRAVNLAIVPSLGDSVELRGTIATNGTLTIGQSINDGAEITAASTGNVLFRPAFAGQRLYLNSGGVSKRSYGSFLAVKVASGVRSRQYMRESM